METKIFKKVTPFFLALLIVLANLPATAQRDARNDRNPRNNNGNSQVNERRPVTTNQTRLKQPVTRNGERYTNRGQNGNRFANNNRRANVNVNFNNRNNRNFTCAPSVIIRQNPKRYNGYGYGNRVSFLPQNAITFRGVNRNYFFARGNFYVQGYGSFRTALIPIGATVGFLPNRARTVFFGRDVYHQLGNVYLAERIGRRGQVFYQVVGYV